MKIDKNYPGIKIKTFENSSSTMLVFYGDIQSDENIIIDNHLLVLSGNIESKKSIISKGDIISSGIIKANDFIVSNGGIKSGVYIESGGYMWANKFIEAENFISMNGITTKDIKQFNMKYNVSILDNHIQIGMEIHSKDKWFNFTDEEILSLSSFSDLEWWKENKSKIFKKFENKY